MKKQSHLGVIGFASHGLIGLSVCNEKLHKNVKVVEVQKKESSMNRMKEIEITNPYKDIQENTYNIPKSGQESRRERRNPKLKNKPSHLLKKLEKNKLFK